MFTQTIRPAIVLFFLLAVITGLIYPFAITGVAQVVFPWQANGSLLYRNGQPIGSALIGQPIDDPKYFWGRISATSPFPYNAASSSGSNYGPLSSALTDEVKAQVDALKAADAGSNGPAPLNPATSSGSGPDLKSDPSIPVDLVTSSGSGLDPHISVAAALYQAPRVARARDLSEDQVRTLVQQHTEGRTFTILGEPRVNVLELNLALDALK
jgi:potassium-transporting ATPase KdpC subunit